MFYIPFVKHEMQEEICKKIEESQRLKTESEGLLNKAKRAVELAIEEGEEAAMAYVLEKNG
jgi:type I restriction enzyme, S subunit